MDVKEIAERDKKRTAKYLEKVASPQTLSCHYSLTLTSFVLQDGANSASISSTSVVSQRKKRKMGPEESAGRNKKRTAECLDQVASPKY